jgi:hypothetical protein
MVKRLFSSVAATELVGDLVQLPLELADVLDSRVDAGGQRFALRLLVLLEGGHVFGCDAVPGGNPLTQKCRFAGPAPVQHALAQKGPNRRYRMA